MQPSLESLADVFYITPTTWLDGSRWNAPLQDRETNEMLVHTVRGQASAFNSVGDVWAPRYRQATYGAFLTYEPDAGRALALAETDVMAAFDVFLTARAARAGGRNRPFVLAGHSQGALHLAQLLKKRISGTPLRADLIAAYVIGWPVSVEHDLAALPDIESCRGPVDTGCVIGWMTFGTSPDTGDLFDCFDHQVGLDGVLNADSQMLCVNPLSWRQDTTPVPSSANLGSLTPVDTGDPIGALEMALVGATCRADGVLELSHSPQGPWREWVSGDEDYHVYDVNLFWANIRANVRHRVATHLGR